MIHPFGMLGFTLLRAMSTYSGVAGVASEVSRPFDARRDGFVMGEGAGVAILEHPAGARRRGARIYGEVAGYGLACDVAEHRKARNSEPTRRAARGAPRHPPRRTRATAEDLLVVLLERPGAGLSDVGKSPAEPPTTHDGNQRARLRARSESCAFQRPSTCDAYRLTDEPLDGRGAVRSYYST
jgi:Beta-ketoacyl synthase, N-terminal domain